MQVRINSFVCSVILFAAGIFITSCNSGSNGNNSKNGIDTGKNITDTTPVKPVTKDISGVLDILWIESSEFDKLTKEQLVFNFAFRSNNILTMHGWSVKNGTCTGSYGDNPTPDIKLKNGAPTLEKYGPDIYFGSTIVGRNAIKHIQRSFVKKYKFIVFIPKVSEGFIGYEIYASDDPTTKFTNMQMLVDTDEEANPSPPKNYNED